jgi:uncharacterized membrane protein YbaN (DUF454 family)
MIADWRLHGAMQRRTKRWAAFTMVLSFGVSIALMPSPWHRILLLVVAAVLGYFIWRVPVRPDSTPLE